MVQKQALQATGRRKTSVARVRLLPGTGKVTINRKPIDMYARISTKKVFEQTHRICGTR